MKWVKYGKFTGEDFGISAEDLMRALSEFFLQSGYERQFHELTMEDLKDAIQQALERERMLPRELPPEEMERLVEMLAQKLMEEGYVSAGDGPDGRQGRIETTDKSLDFLGFKTLKDLLGSLGHPSFR